MTTLDTWKKALGAAGTRSTITQADVDTQTLSQEGYYCNLFYQDTINQALRAAHWNFCKKTDLLTLWKAAPGTKENTSAAPTTWSPNLLPGAPWAYSYMYPNDCIQVRMLVGQTVNSFPAIPIFSGLNQYASVYLNRPGRFEVDVDEYDATGFLVRAAKIVTGATIANGGTGNVVGDVLSVPSSSISPAGYSPIIVPCQFLVTSVAGGAVTAITPLFPTGTIGMGYLKVSPTNPVAVTSSGSGAGVTLNLTLAPYFARQRVISTNLSQPICTYTVYEQDENVWDVDFETCIYAALAAKLANSLTGDKKLANMKIQEANNIILEARLRDANEGMTINDVMPDWIAIRGSGGGYSLGFFIAPYGPLFSLGI